MENYRKSTKFRETLEICLLGLHEKTSAFVVTPITPVRTILSSALESLQKDGQILLVGSGASTDKAVACAEATKSKFQGLHQVTQIMSKRVEEFWEPIKEGMNTLQIVIDVPAIAILLTVSDSSSINSSFEGDVIYGERIFCDGFDP